MNYFSHPFLSNSDLKAFKRKMGLLPEEPENLQEIFELGTLIHATILEPHEANQKHKDYDLALAMRDTFWSDKTCREFAMADDFRREYIYTEERVVGQYKVKLRCKADGARVRNRLLLELKGLNVETEKAFREAMVRFDYDQAIAHYMITADLRMALVVGISKKDPKKLYRWFVKRYDDFYAIGEQKLIDNLKLLREISPEDVPLAA